MTREEAIAAYEDWFHAPEQEWVRDMAIKTLLGYDLVCWCAPKPCHADVILRYLLDSSE